MIKGLICTCAQKAQNGAVAEKNDSSHRKGKGRRWKPASRSLADLAGEVIAPLAEKHGLATAQIILRWSELAGPALARATQPLRIGWPRHSDHGGEEQRQPAGATLIVTCESALALDLQFAAPAIIERVNLLFGWQAVTRLSIRQGPVARKPVAQPPAIPPDAPAEMVSALALLEDDGLRQALGRLAAGVAARRRRS